MDKANLVGADKQTATKGNSNHLLQETDCNEIRKQNQSEVQKAVIKMIGWYTTAIKSVR